MSRQRGNIAKNFVREMEITKYREYYNWVKVSKQSRNKTLNILSDVLSLLQGMKNKSYRETENVSNIYYIINTLLLELFDKNSNVVKEFNKVAKVVGKEPIKEPKTGYILSDALVILGKGIMSLEAERKEKFKKTLEYRTNLIHSLINSYKDFGLHDNIENREQVSFCIGIKINGVWETKMFLNYDELQKGFLQKFESINYNIKINGKVFKVSDAQETLIINTKYNAEELKLFCLSQSMTPDEINFINLHPNNVDKYLPDDINESYENSVLSEAAIELKNLIITTKAPKGKKRNEYYVELRNILKSNTEAWNITPDYIKNHHTYTEYWSVYGSKFDRQYNVSQKFQPLITFLESTTDLTNKSNVQKVLDIFDSPHIKEHWKKSTEKTESDPEEAITRGKSLLEGVFKHILEYRSIDYKKDTTFPELYKLVSKELQLSPEGAYEKIFNQVFNGIKSIIEGINAIRGKMSTAHGMGIKQGSIKPDKKHAELVVSLSGAMSVYLIETLEENKLK